MVPWTPGSLTSVWGTQSSGSCCMHLEKEWAVTGSLSFSPRQILRVLKIGYRNLFQTHSSFATVLGISRFWAYISRAGKERAGLLISSMNPCLVSDLWCMPEFGSGDHFYGLFFSGSLPLFLLITYIQGAQRAPHILVSVETETSLTAQQWPQPSGEKQVKAGCL